MITELPYIVVPYGAITGLHGKYFVASMRKDERMSKGDYTEAGAKHLRNWLNERAAGYPTKIVLNSED